MKNPPALGAAFGATVLIALASSVGAQSITGSETHFIPGQTVPASGGRSLSFFGSSVEGTLGQVFAGQAAASANFQLQDGVVWMPPVGTPEPIVAGVRHVVGDKDGGETYSVFGYNLQGSPLSVAFDGQPGTGTAVVSNLEATTTTPDGTNSFTNPKGQVDVAVFNALGAHAANDAFVYGPALIEESQTKVGGRFQLRFQTTPGDFFFLAMGKSAGIGVPVPQFEGLLRLIFNVQLVAQSVPVPTGSFLLDIPVPNDPVLAGGVVEFQAVSLFGALTGKAAFSHLFVLTIQ